MCAGLYAMVRINLQRKIQHDNRRVLSKDIGNLPSSPTCRRSSLRVVECNTNSAVWAMHQSFASALVHPSNTAQCSFSPYGRNKDGFMFTVSYFERVLMIAWHTWLILMATLGDCTGESLLHFSIQKHKLLTIWLGDFFIGLLIIWKIK